MFSMFLRIRLIKRCCFLRHSYFKTVPDKMYSFLFKAGRNMPAAVQVELSLPNNLLPKWVLIIIKFFLSYGLIYMHILFISTVLHITKTGTFFSDGKFLITISYISTIITLYRLIWIRKELTAAVITLASELYIVNPKLYRRRRLEIIFASLVIIGCFIFVGICGNLTTSKHNHQRLIAYLSQLCFNCNVLNLPRWFSYFLIYWNGFSFVSIALGCPFMICMFYCFVASTLTDLIKHTGNYFNKINVVNSVSSVGLFEQARFEIERIRELVDSFNHFFGGVALFWSASALLDTCHGVLWVLLLYFNRSEYHEIVFRGAVYFKSLFLLIVNTLAGSRIFEKTEDLKRKLHCWVNFALKNGKDSELKLLYLQLSKPKIAFKIGDIYIVTKNLLVSFAGLVTTYVVIYIQLSPEVLTYFNELHNNFTIEKP